jgi:DNA polymerase-3 subunit delta
MAQKKASEVESWLRKPDSRASVVLIYGPDRGLVSERAQAFARACGLPMDDPFTVVRLDAAEVDRDPGKLLDEARMVPMFSPKRLVWVRNAGAQKPLADDVKALCAAPPADAIVLIEAGDLRKGTPMRSAVEAAPAAMALPCFSDEARDLDAVIDDELRQAGMTIDAEARQLLRRNLGGDRLASRGEILKLVLYAQGETQILRGHVEASVGDAAAVDMDGLLDAMLGGQVEAFDVQFARVATNASQASTLLGAALRQLHAVQLMRAAVDAGARPGEAVAAARPPVFFSRRRTVEQAVSRWTGAMIERSLERLGSAMLSTRRRPDLALALTRQCLMASTVEAARLDR